MYEYYDRAQMEKEWIKRSDRSEKQVTYYTRAQTSYDPEELELCNELNRVADIRYLTELLHAGDMKSFYAIAERVLRVKPANPVVMMITTVNWDIVDDRDEVDKAIKEYFEAIYKAPEEWSLRMEVSDASMPS